jgi:hypothetical protein
LAVEFKGSLATELAVDDARRLNVWLDILFDPCRRYSSLAV